MRIESLRLRSDRLALRPFTAGDLKYTVDVMSRPNVVRYLPWGVLNRDETETLLKKRMQSTELSQPGDQLVLAVERRDTGQLVGDVMLRWSLSPHRQGELGYAFHPDARGQGFATEAARFMQALGFDEIGFHRIFAQCDARHLASARVMARLGMREEAHFIENEWFKGEWGSLLVYAMLDHEWETLQARSTRDS